MQAVVYGSDRRLVLCEYSPQETVRSCRKQLEPSVPSAKNKDPHLIFFER